MSTFTEIEKKIDEAFKPYQITVGEMKKMLSNQSDDDVIVFKLGKAGNTPLHPYEQWSSDGALNMTFVEE